MQLRAVAILGVLAMAGCGGSDDKPAADIDRPAEAMLCPSVEHGAKPSTPTFDAREILGRSTTDAETLAKENGCTVRIVVEDGEERPQTMDLRSERINVVVQDGTVVELRGIG